MVSKSMESLMKNNSIIREMFDEGKRLEKIYGEENVFDFSIGNPNVTPPKEIKENIIKVLNDENPLEIHGYMNNSGYSDVRENIAKYLTETKGIYLEGKNIIMTCGAAGGLNIIMKTIINQEDEVIILAPYFGEYVNYINNYNGRTVIVSCNKDNFEPNLSELREKITDKTKAIIINSPNNPSGVIYSEETIKSISDILRESSKRFGTNIYLISDEPYREIVYDDVSVPYILKYYDNSLIVYSYSKSLSLPGERIGYIVVNPSIDDLLNMLSALNIANRVLGFVNAPSLFQKVVGMSLDLEVDVDIYKKNRDLLYTHLTDLGFECLKPKGAFYLFPKSLIEDDKKFCDELKKFNILAVPGSVFGCDGHFRLSYCIKYEKIEKSLKAFDKVAELFNEYV